VEPWISRLEQEAGGRILVDDRDAITTVLVSRTEFLSSRRELVRKLVAAHRELTEWIKTHPDEAQQMAREELDAELRAKLSPELVASAWNRVVLTSDVSVDALKTYVASARSVGFLRDVPDISGLIESP